MDGEVQAALYHHGARHLIAERGIFLGGAYREALSLMTAVLSDPKSDRWLSALAPVFVWNVDTLPLSSLWANLERLQFGRRVGWFAENVAEFTRGDLEVSGEWERRVRLAHSEAVGFREHLEPPNAEVPLDVLNVGLRTPRAVEKAIETSSSISRRWRVVSMLHPSEFKEELLSAVYAE